MSKKDFNVVGNNDNQELAKGIAFVKSCRAPLNVAQMVLEMNAKTISNGVLIDTVYADTSSAGDYDRKEIGWLFDVLKDTDFKVVVVKSLNDITDDILDLEEFVRTITGISVSTLGQVEQGGRNLSMKNLYMLMDVYQTDANALLAIDTTSDSLDSKLRELPVDKQDYLRKSFNYMIEQALQSA